MLVFVGVIIYVLSLKNSREEWSEDFLANNISGAEKITCTYKHVLNSSYSNNKITQALPLPETNPLIFTFSKINSDEPELSYIDSTQTITTTSIVTLVNREDKIVFLEGSENYLTMHTIYPDKGVATYTKNVDIFGIPSASLSMGTCTGY